MPCQVPAGAAGAAVSEVMFMNMVRTLEYWPRGATESRPIRVSISVPEPHPRYDWACTLTIDGFDEPYTKTFSGADAIQALTLTCGIVPDVLRYLTRNGGSVNWNGKEHLGFPPRSPFHDLDFVPADGSATREIAVRIGTAEKIGEHWSALVEVYGFDEPHAERIQGPDWAQALELAAKAVPDILEREVKKAGGGTLAERCDACPIASGD